MNQNGQVRVAYYSPDILNICVDRYENGDFSGRMYHRYKKAPELFGSVMELTTRMDAFFDRISFPQAAVRTRSFTDTKKSKREKSGTSFGSPERRGQKVSPEKVVSLEELMAQQGEKGTFFISVRYRQNACWQGELEWAEGKKTERFVSLLDMIKLIHNAVDAPSKLQRI